MSLFPRKSAARKRRTPETGSVLRVAANARAASTTDGLPAGALAIFGGVSLLVFAWGAWLLASWCGRLLFTENEAFTLRHIRAERGVTLTPELLTEWADIPEGANLFKLSIREIRERLEANAIIRQAVLRRELPDTLHIRVIERVPLARVGQAEGRMNWLVDAEGVIINKSFQSKHLPFLLGVTDTLHLGARIAVGRARQALSYLSRLRELPAVKRELLDVRVISVGHPEYLDWRLADGTQLLLPREGDARGVLERASRVLYENKVHNLGRRAFDLRPEAGTGNAIAAPR